MSARWVARRGGVESSDRGRIIHGLRAPSQDPVSRRHFRSGKVLQKHFSPIIFDVRIDPDSDTVIRLVKKTALLLAGVVVSFLVAEIAVRLLRVAPRVAILDTGRFRLSDDPRIGYEPIPGYEYHFTRKSYRGRGNSLGLRDREHELDKLPGTLRIAVLGDSIAAGLKIDDRADVFPFVLERMLNGNDLNAEVLNFAVNGYNTMQEVALFERSGLTYQPDLVLVAYCLNDVERSDGQVLDGLMAVNAGQLSRSSPWVRRALTASALYRYVRYRLLSPRRRPPEELGRKYARLYENTVVESLQELTKLGATHNFDVLLVVFPYFYDVVDYDPRYAVSHEQLGTLSQSLGIQFLDLRQTFRECGEPPGRQIANDPLHPNETGHRCAADSMARFIAHGYRGGLFRNHDALLSH